MSLCLTAAGLSVVIAASSFSLSWTHTIEKTEWREEWRLEDGRLRLVEASVKGSGAGMEPPGGAVLKDGAYAWEPAMPTLSELVLRRDPHAGDWRLCAAGRCDALGGWLDREADPVTVAACS